MLVVEKGEPAVLIRHNQAKKKTKKAAVGRHASLYHLNNHGSMAKVRVEESAI